VFSILDRTHLWRIFDILREFELVRIRHEHVSRIIDELATGAADDFVMEVGLVTRYRQYIKSAHTVVDIADVLASLQAKFGEAVASLETVRKVGVGKIYKRPGMRNLYQDARGAGLERLAGKYGVDVGMFATALKNAMPDSYVPETDLVMPEEAAKAFVCSAFPTVEMVLQGARSIIALEIASDPSIRQFVRKIFDSDALVSIFPTERGRLEIEENHPFYVCACCWLMFRLSSISGRNRYTSLLMGSSYRSWLPRNRI
jgi:transcription elongation factor SPT6